MMQGRNPSFWSMNSLMPPSQQISNLLASSSASSSSLSSDFPKFSKGASFSSMIPCHETQELPESWSQLLLGGLVEEEEEGCTNYAPYTAKRVENWEYQGLCASANGHMAGDVKQEDSGSEAGKAFYYGRDHQEADLGANKSSWSSQVVAASSPRSCITTSFSSNLLNFSNCKSQKKQLQASDHSSECNGNSSAFKKAKVQASSAQSPLKVRKEKLGDRIATLHQIVSPFGKTDTASVLQEAIGYIRFLQGQIQALSSPYLGRGTRNTTRQQCGKGDYRNSIFAEEPGQLLKDACMKRREPHEQSVGDDDEAKDLRSRGLCLVPLSFTMHVGTADNGADYWAPNFGMAFR